MSSGGLVFRLHALRRMRQRGISIDDVEHVIESGEVIENYPDDTPYPSRLMLGWQGSRSLHVVAADARQTGETIIITAYEPDPHEWEQDLKTRRRP